MELVHRFNKDIAGMELPARFNNPFYYSPHPLCLLAADEVRGVIISDKALCAEARKGKMFGVLVVEDARGGVGYLMAFSGLLFGRNRYGGFVPPVYDMQSPCGYFKKEEAAISAINSTIKSIENSAEFRLAAEALHAVQSQAEKDVAEKAALFKANKEERRKRRETGVLSAGDEALLVRQSQYEKAELKRVRRHWDALEAEKADAVKGFNVQLSLLSAERRARSLALQKWLFEQFMVLNGKGESKSLLAIFNEKLSALPPAGAGECAGPKLLQYAYANSLQPLAMAEFWVGASPVGEVRRDGCFYASCKSKCEPILSFMLQGLHVEENALEKGGDINDMEIVYEDDSLLVVDKPSGVLSVPGVVGVTSVQQWLRSEYLHSNDVYVVHRLDMATSGLLVAAKSMDVYKSLQRQFAECKVKKCYTALLDGIPAEHEGTIELPLAPDYPNRPRQKVDYETGKPAITHYRVVGCVQYLGKECALVKFVPVTGRTHQLRVHAASCEGLNCPIVGDSLYGNRGERLMLHASSISFAHPVSGENVVFERCATFVAQ